MTHYHADHHWQYASEAKCKAARAWLSEGLGVEYVAEFCGLTEQVVNVIHDQPAIRMPPNWQPPERMAPARVAAIQAAILDGEYPHDIAARLHTSRSTVYRLRRELREGGKSGR